MASGSKDAKNYAYTGPFDEDIFQKRYTEEFKGIPKFNLASMADLVFLLGKVGNDPRINDIRWAAYLLATAFIESSHTVRMTKQTTDKNGRARIHSVKVWRNFAPTDEAGHGRHRRYFLPVKVKRLPNGDARITEYDGEQWTISAATGGARPRDEDQERGVDATAKTSPTYYDDDGDEHLYYGRGFVQLTWWNGYANAGVALGRGLALLFHPELVNEPNIAYEIMATGMCTGRIYANKRKFSGYFHGGHTDYIGARSMVNAGATHANKVELTKIAERFEKVLFDSRITPEIASQ